MITKVFHVLKWTSRELDRTIAALLEEGTVREIGIEGIEGPQLVLSRLITTATESGSRAAAPALAGHAHIEPD
jgi:hypothetical protein